MIGSDNLKEIYEHVSINDRIIDIVNHPAFEGFGRFIFPLEWRIPNRDMTLRNVSSLLPYHSNVRAENATDTINYMIDKVMNGEKIFYDIYSQQEKQNINSKNNTGLFFFKGKPGAPFAIVCAGGGFSYVGAIHESFPHAIELSKMGYNAFSLQYRANGEEIACEDLAAAIAFIFENAELLQVGTQGYSVWGGSAGARMAADIGTYGIAYFRQHNYPKPAAVVMAYTGHSSYSKNDPPTFSVIGENDGIASVSVMERRANAMKAAGIPVEFHRYKNQAHGFGLGIGTSAEGWINLAVKFWEKNKERR